ncbi:hypothetical protein RCZ15_05940 [Capnocytophaga catalasegens]|uniref:Uncharacterized protein n=1 Tax=Capnocytophaga catalasegens TaxID=1004260 RepID=A0AAV5AQK9_9FLAO|nr:hypothetical protein RCZ03_02770 [Capnocytophaga catalasegens]GJM49619.1 hypothetical protein RCZ15_05940 [Capnocytophaga catalasegens]GJM52898.1 hypothetical protein RCZ16_12150 [Capnocytophaga catalasegens]
MNFIKKYGLLVVYILFLIYTIERIIHLENNNKRIIFFVALLYLVFRLAQIGFGFYKNREK